MAEETLPKLSEVQEMVQNLRSEHSGQCATIQFNVWAYSSGSNSIEFWMGVGMDTHGKNYGSWDDLVADYQHLMRRKDNILFRKFK